MAARAEAAAPLGASGTPPCFTLTATSASPAGTCTKGHPASAYLAGVAGAVLCQAALAERTTRRATVVAPGVDESRLVDRPGTTRTPSRLALIVMPRAQV